MYTFEVKKIEGKTGIQVDCFGIFKHNGEDKEITTAGHFFNKNDIDEDIKKTLINIAEEAKRKV